MLIIREETFETIADLWLELLPRSPGATVFHTLRWQETWWRHFGDGAALRLLSLRDDGFQAVAPLMERGRVVSFLGGTDLVDYHDFITSEQPDSGFFDALMSRLAADGEVDALELLSVPDGSATLDGLPAAARAVGWRVEVETEDVAPRLALPPTWDEYMASLSRKNRHELRRKLRRLEGAGRVRFVEVAGAAAIAEGLDDFVALVRKSGPEKAAFLTPERERFFRAVAVALAEEDAARLSFLELDQERVAVSLSFIHGKDRLLYNSGYDPQYRRLAVGLLAHAFNIRCSIEQGLQVYDFMRGDEPYKYHLGAEDRTIHRIVARRQ
ncbi:MAG: GNAT family N-acetyltransferase [Chloroflexi bacterium]|nr:GNAT family N-acetyltransferase [Chloroflexota bacterium]